MRVLIAPDGFGGTLTPAEAARAIAAGWASVAPSDVLDLAPMSDGGPGFVDVVAAAVPGAERRELTVEDPLARPTTAGWLWEAATATAYVEAAQACGLHLLTEPERDAGRTTTFGVGQLVRAALDAGARRLVVGLGGSATNDGGAGLLAALGVARLDVAGARLAPGGLALRASARLEGRPDPRLAHVELTVACDVDNPLLGLRGASAVFGPQKGASREDVALLDAALQHWADLLEALLGVTVRDEPGAGAAGGLGAALLAVGGRRSPGVALVLGLVGLHARAAAADLVLTGEGTFDATSLSGKVVSGVAAAAGLSAVPVVVLAGQSRVGRRELGAAGLDSAWSMVEHSGLDASLAEPARELAALAARVARQWSR